MSTYQKAFTFIELLIVQAIIAILATVAIPQYQDFVGRAQVADAVNLIIASRVDIEEHIMERGHFPDDERFQNMSTGRSGLYTEKLDITLADTCSTAGVIEATMRYAGVSSNIAGRTFVIERDLEGNWRCARGHENALDDRYLPNTCHIAPVPDHDFPICPIFKTGDNMPDNGGDNNEVAVVVDYVDYEPGNNGNGNGNGGGNGNGNNGHGNNYDSVDVSNPGKSKKHQNDESGDVDDEIHG